MRKSFFKKLSCFVIAAAMVTTEVVPAFAAENNAGQAATEVQIVDESKATGVAAKPAPLTGVQIKGSGLVWDSQSNINNTLYGYDVMATTATGETFYSFYGENPDKGYTEYGFDNVESHYGIIQSAWFDLDADWLGTSRPYTGTENVNYMVPGTAYNYQVRAVNRNTVEAADGTKTVTYYYGDWSAPISYTLPTCATISALSLAEIEDNTLYLNLGTKVPNYYIHAELYSDAACTQRVERNTYLSPRANDETVRAYFSSLEPGKTYYVRVYNAPESFYNAEALNKAGYPVQYSNVVEVNMPAAPAEEVAPATTSLSQIKTDSEGIYFNTTAFDAMKLYKKSHGVRYYYSLDNTNWSLFYTQDSIGDKPYISYYELAYIAKKPDTTIYIKAVPYAEKGKGVDSNTIEVKSPAVSSISALTYEQVDNEIKFRYTGNVHDNESVIYQISTNKEFNQKVTSLNTIDDKGVIITTANGVNFDELTPGNTYYVRACVESDYYENTGDTIAKYYISAFTNVVTIKAKVAKIGVDADVTSTTVKLTAKNYDGATTGYQFARKVGKKYVELGKTTDRVFTDSKLTKDTKYTYRVRAYYYNNATKKTYYGAYSYVQATTWGSALKLKATPATKNSIKLTWNKVSGAKGYEIYRVVGGHESVYDNSNEGAFSKAQLIKTYTKASKKSYTDKKLTAGASYTYIVRAYREIAGKKYYISETAYATLALNGVTIQKTTVNQKTGTKTVKWAKDAAATGYLIERCDNDTNQWVTVKKTTKNSTVTYTFRAVPADKTSERYRIRSYKGAEYSDATEVYTDKGIAVVTGVKVTKDATNGIVGLTWNPVAGADYYKVFRGTDARTFKDIETGAVSNISAYSLYNNVPDVTEDDGYKALSYVTGTTFVDQKIAYTNDLGEEVVINKGPEAGVKYYYYVLAYKIQDDEYDAQVAAANESYLTNFSSIASYGFSKPVSATLTTAKVGKATVKSVKSSKKNSVTIKIKKKVAKAVRYEIYRSSKKSKGFVKIGTTTKLTYTDKTAKSGKTYYYKVRVVSENEAKATIYSAYSKVSKKVKVKK